MTIRIIGAVLIVAGSGCFGLLLASNHRREVEALRAFLKALDLMECELQYRRTALPALCRQAAQEQKGVLKTFFENLSDELESQARPSVDACVCAAVSRTGEIPEQTKQMIQSLGKSLGQFDLDGQLLGIRANRAEGERLLENLCSNQDVRMRNYQTLGLCAGAAVVILFI